MSNSPSRRSKNTGARSADQAERQAEHERVAPAVREGGADLGDTILIRVYSDHLFPEDVTVLDGIPVTKPARTLLDLATVCDDRELDCALTEALRRGLTSFSEVLAVIDRYPWHQGGPRLRRLTGAWSRRQSP